MIRLIYDEFNNTKCKVDRTEFELGVTYRKVVSCQSVKVLLTNKTKAISIVKPTGGTGVWRHQFHSNPGSSQQT
jgi:hypothetical protein